MNVISATCMLFLIFASSDCNYVNNECKSRRLAGCICSRQFYYDKNHFVVNCTDLGFTDTSMLKDLPEETEALIFTGNEIPTLPWNIFGDLDKLSMLKIIDMSNNRIREIKGKSYHHVKSVETLILNHNYLIIADDDEMNYHHSRVFSNFINLRELHLTNAFRDNTGDSLAEDLHDIFYNSNLTKLFKLHLEQNEIKNFKDPDVFCDLRNLRQLYLGNNALSKLTFNVNCLKLQFLDLEKNNISRMSVDDLNSLDHLYNAVKPQNFTVDLRGNPFDCDHASEFYNWMINTNVTLRNKGSLECVDVKYGNRYNVNIRDLAIMKHEKLSKAIVVLLGVLVIVLVSLLAAYIYMNKDKVRTKLSPIIDTVTRKVQYTTIDSQIV